MEEYLALARTGSAHDVDMLIAHIEQERQGDRRASLRQVLASVNNRATAAHLIKRLAETSDDDVALGLQQSVSAMADGPITAQLVAIYETAPDAGALRVAETIEWITADSALPVLAEVVNAPGISLRDRLSVSALRAIARIGTPFAAATLARRLDAARDEDEMKGLSALLASINRSGTQNELAAIAQGKQDATQTFTSIAALWALNNYHDEHTNAVVTALASDPDPEIAAFARSILQARK